MQFNVIDYIPVAGGTLGAGAFGCALLVQKRNRVGERYVMKIVQGDLAENLMEAQTGYLLSNPTSPINPFVMRVLGIALSNVLPPSWEEMLTGPCAKFFKWWGKYNFEGEFAFILMEYAPYGDGLDFAANMVSAKRTDVLYNIRTSAFSLLWALHGGAQLYGFSHNDLKPANVLTSYIDNEDFVLHTPEGNVGFQLQAVFVPTMIDFGLSYVYNTRARLNDHYAGSIDACAPETLASILLFNREPDRFVGQDVWAVGNMLLQWAAGMSQIKIQPYIYVSVYPCTTDRIWRSSSTITALSITQLAVWDRDGESYLIFTCPNISLSERNFVQTGLDFLLKNGASTVHPDRHFGPDYYIQAIYMLGQYALLLENANFEFTLHRFKPNVALFTFFSDPNIAESLQKLKDDAVPKADYLPYHGMLAWFIETYPETTPFMKQLFSWDYVPRNDIPAMLTESFFQKLRGPVSERARFLSSEPRLEDQPPFNLITKLRKKHVADIVTTGSQQCQNLELTNCRNAVKFICGCCGEAFCSEECAKGGRHDRQ